MKPIITANRYIFNILSYLPQTARGRRRRKLIMRSLSLKLSHEFQHHENDSTKISKERERWSWWWWSEWDLAWKWYYQKKLIDFFVCLSSFVSPFTIKAQLLVFFLSFLLGFWVLTHWLSLSLSLVSQLMSL